MINNNKLLGAVTEGGIRRLFHNMGKISFNELYNTKIKYIVYTNDKQVYEDAGRIFALNGRIHNIPVINEEGKLLFQIDRYEQNINTLSYINDILEAVSNGSLEYFLKSCGTDSEIIITGSDKKSLNNAEKIIKQYYSKLLSDIGIVYNGCRGY